MFLFIYPHKILLSIFLHYKLVIFFNKYAVMSPFYFLHLENLRRFYRKKRIQHITKIRLKFKGNDFSQIVWVLNLVISEKLRKRKKKYLHKEGRRETWKERKEVNEQVAILSALVMMVVVMLKCFLRHEDGWRMLL